MEESSTQKCEEGLDFAGSTNLEESAQAARFSNLH